MSPRVPLAASIVTGVALLAAVVVAGSAPAAPARPAKRTTITGKGVGAVRIGARFVALHQADRLGKLRPGCELAGPGARAARLRKPLRGSVELGASADRRVTSILVTGGATARGVGIGATAGAVRDAFPKARTDRSTEELFGLTLLRVPAGAGGRLEFGVDTVTRKVTVIGIPFIAFCE